MGRSRRPRIPGIPKDAERNVESIVREFEERIRKLEQKAGRPGFVSSDTAAIPGELLNIEAPASGLTVILPQATPALRNARVVLNTRNTNPVKVVAIGGTVNGSTFVTSTSAGTFEAVCNGYDGWSLPGYVTPSGSGLLGRTGPMGPPGFDGDAGQDSFIPGPPGLTGKQGCQGAPGWDGADGGDSFVPGPQGLTGKQGCQGAPGFDGIDGGDSFVPGPAGAAGAAGVAGAAGAMGLQGPPGEWGPEGQESFIPGPPGPTGKFVPTSDTVILSGISGAQGVVDISGLECGGRVGIQATTGDWSIEGFTAREEGFWFILTAASTAFTCTITNSTTAGTGIRCPGHVNFTCERQMQGVLMYGSFGAGTQWLFIPGAGGPLFMGDGTGMPTTGDIRKGTDADLEIHSGTGINVFTTNASSHIAMQCGLSAPFSVVAGSVDLDAANGGMVLEALNDISARCDSFVLSNTAGTGQGFLEIVEGGGTLTVPAGNCQLKALNLSPCQFQVVDDVNAAWDMNVFGVAVQTAIQSVTNATTAITAATFSVPGNTLRAGTTYYICAMGNYTRGATATAHNIVFNLNFGGSVYQTRTFAANVAAGTYAWRLTGFFSCLSIGAAGTFIGQMQIINNLVAITSGAPTTAQLTEWMGFTTSTAAAGTTKDTTAAQTLSLTLNMSAAVASCVLRSTNAFIMKVSN